jgi:phosphatidylinositol-3-phosphatase
MSRRSIVRRIAPLAAAVVAVTVAVAPAMSAPATAESGHGHGRKVVRAALPRNAIRHVIVIDLENESFSSTFGPSSPATYLNKTLVPRGELIEHYYATGHVSLDNYIAQISGQAPNPLSSSDCTAFVNGVAKDEFADVTPGTLDPDQTTFPGQVDGSGCVYPARVPTIADQLDATFGKHGGRRAAQHAEWRVYAEDMGNTSSRDGGAPDPLGGTDCAHPAVGGSDPTNSATAADQYATRHNPAVYFHSIIDDTSECDANVVPLGNVKVGAAGAPDSFRGHLAQDLAKESTTPKFAFITPNLCNDGHDANCAGVNTEGGKTGGLVGADLWLKHWMPLVLGSPAYRSGRTLVVITFDEGNPITDTASCCNEKPGPAQARPGFSPLLAAFGIPQLGPGTGGGQIGAVLLNSRYIVPGTDNTTGSYNHYSALRSYEDLLGLERGGTDGLGHLGFAAQPGLAPFGRDVFNISPHRRHGRS